MRNACSVHQSLSLCHVHKQAFQACGSSYRRALQPWSKNRALTTIACSATEASAWDFPSSGERHSWLRQDLNLVLVNPVIPQNVGNVARTCAATGIGLHLVGPLGFQLDDRKLRRAGLDYWPYVCCKVHDSWQDFLDFHQSLPDPKRLIGYSKFASKHFASEGLYGQGDWLVFGAETTGLPDEVHNFIPQSGGFMVKIPMKETHVRSLNLATSVGVGAYEAIRQLDGPQL